MTKLLKYVLLYAACITGLPLICQETEEKPSPADPERERALVGKALNFRRDLAFRLEDPLLAGKDVSAVLDLYMQGRALGSKEPILQINTYLKGMHMLKEKIFKPLPKATWPENPTKVPMILKESFTVPQTLWDSMKLPPVSGISFRVVEYQVDGLKLYGVMTEAADKDVKRPLIIFAHGAAFGVPEYMLPWMAYLADRGYTVAAPAFRGEPLLTRSFAQLPHVPDYKCEGNIENLLGEVNDLLGMATGLREKGLVQGEKYAVVGHSYGSGAGLLAAARTKDIACVISYDAWMTDPFLFYWERLANEGSVNNKDYLWGSWDEFTKQPAMAQLNGLMARSIVHHVERINAPLLLFTGGGYNGSAYHYAHKELVRKLREHGKTFRYEIMPGGGHNFVLYYTNEPALTAFKIQMQWLKKYFPAQVKK